MPRFSRAEQKRRDDFVTRYISRKPRASNAEVRTATQQKFKMGVRTERIQLLREQYEAAKAAAKAAKASESFAKGEVNRRGSRLYEDDIQAQRDEHVSWFYYNEPKATVDQVCKSLEETFGAGMIEARILWLRDKVFKDYSLNPDGTTKVNDQAKKPHQLSHQAQRDLKTKKVNFLVGVFSAQECTLKEASELLKEQFGSSMDEATISHIRATVKASAAALEAKQPKRVYNPAVEQEQVVTDKQVAEAIKTLLGGVPNLRNLQIVINEDGKVEYEYSASITATFGSGGTLDN